MDSSNQNAGSFTDDFLVRDLVDFRHLGVFREAYQEKSHLIKGPLNRKSVCRIISNLERVFECSLFSPVERGKLLPSPFADRLFNDLRFLDGAQGRLDEHVRGVRDAGRVVLVGSSPAIFRTRWFRNLFRDLQMMHGVRPSFVPIDSSMDGRALTSGLCDLHVGFPVDDGNRFAYREAGHIGYMNYHRLADDRRSHRGEPSPPCHVVSLEGNPPVLSESGTEADTPCEPITDGEWIDWLDHPERCPGDTWVLAPEMQIDERYWQAGDEGCFESPPIQFSWLRQHSYEFLPGLVDKVARRITPR